MLGWRALKTTESTQHTWDFVTREAVCFLSRAVFWFADNLQLLETAVKLVHSSRMHTHSATEIY